MEVFPSIFSCARLDEVVTETEYISPIVLGTIDQAVGWTAYGVGLHEILEKEADEPNSEPEPATSDSAVAGYLLWYKYTSVTSPNPDAWAPDLGAGIGLGGWQQFKQVFGGENGVIYAIHPNGNLVWYKYTSLDSPDPNAWASGVGKGIGLGGWQQFEQVFGGYNGVIYAVHPNGNLVWYKYTSLDNADPNAWAPGTGTGIGLGGWQQFKQVFGGENGVIYAVHPNGNLIWYKYTSLDNPDPNAWALGMGKTISVGGWQNYTQVFGGENGVIYAVHPNGNLIWYKYTSPDSPNPNAWAPGSGTAIGLGGWQNYKQVFGGCNGLIYAIVPKFEG